MKQVLLIDGQGDRHWVEALRQTAAQLGRTLVLIDQHRAAIKVKWDYELVMLDANIGTDLISMIKHIRLQNSRAQIVVVSSAPLWKQAREVLLIGAADYVNKSDDQEEIQSILERNLSPMGGSLCEA